MHANLHQIQELIIQAIREWQEHHRAHPPRLEVVAALALAEKPLTRQELALRAGLARPETDAFVQLLLTHGLLTCTHPDAAVEEQTLEGAHDLEETLSRLAHHRLDEMVNRLEPRVAKARELLESCRTQFDGFDWLVARQFRLKINGLERLLRLARQRDRLLGLIGSGDVVSAPLKPVSIR
jgi:hypothetical protein